MKWHKVNFRKPVFGRVQGLPKLGPDQRERQTSNQAVGLGLSPRRNWSGAFKDRLTGYDIHRLTKIYKLSDTVIVYC